MTQASEVKNFEQLVGPSHSLPNYAKPLDCFFLFLLSAFFTPSAAETNRYAQNEITAKDVLDMLWKETTADKMKANAQNEITAKDVLDMLWKETTADKMKANLSIDVLYIQKLVCHTRLQCHQCQ